MNYLVFLSSTSTHFALIIRCYLEFIDFGLEFKQYFKIAPPPRSDESATTTMESICFACTRTVLKEDEIVCKGFCKSPFHLECVHQSAEMRNDIAACSQLYWMCKACSKMMANAHFRNAIISTNTVMEMMAQQYSETLEELRKEIAHNTTQINTILQRTPLQTTPHIARSQITAPSRKRPRLLIDAPPQDNPASVGTREADPDEAIPLAAAQKEEKFWLYLSGFDPQATVQQIEKLVRNNLNIDKAVEVVKLVPKGRSLDELTFVSFKVGLELQHRDVALSRSSWQKGIIFRQFDFSHSGTTRQIFRFEPSPGDSQAQ